MRVSIVAVQWAVSFGCSFLAHAAPEVQPSPAVANEPEQGSSPADELVTPTSAPAELLVSTIRLGRRGGLTPFRAIDYAIVVRAATPVAYQTKDLVAYDEALQRMALLTWGEYAALWQTFDAVELGPEALAGPDEPSPAASSSAQWTLELERRGELRRWQWRGERDQLPPGARIAVDAIVGTIKQHTGDIPFRNVFIDPGKRGWVDVQSRPVARVWLDGRETGELTPLQTYELPAGSHQLRLVNAEQGIDETFEFKVEPGVTTILDLELQ